MPEALKPCSECKSIPHLIAAWNRRESPDTERLDWIIEMFNRPDVSTKLTGLQLGKILAGGLVKGVIYPNARAAIDAAKEE